MVKARKIYVLVEFDYPEYEHDGQFSEVVGAYTSQERAEEAARQLSGLISIHETTLYEYF